MSKKWLAGLLALSTLIFSGCGSAGDADKQEQTGSKPAEVTIYLTRHGKTMFNELNRVQGWSDTPLTKDGEKVAVDLGKGLKKHDVKFNSVYSSDLKRAHDTASAVLKGSGQSEPIHELEGLREACSGQFEGESLDTIGAEQAKSAGFPSYEAYEAAKRPKADDQWSWLDDAHYFADKSGYAESSQTVRKRMLRTVKKIGADQSKNGGGNVLVVSHGMAINVMLAGMTDKYKSAPLENASVTKIKYKDGKLEVLSIGDTSYLKEGEKL
ncbi:histidine phosphatase family protein [Bifidobacterium sp. ESL0784]|uniref:histidine phosphatase family protein n=1 Tax=Bifidobacterium sp. ESL0784 TaxID=2983231 RepID=UPI0023F89DC2|nr:histidine phosphatase family protein [Bifidobacterium sp. ESL0784]MDF7640229.1 histidine phosphatase family protein [Bifidobacterium sp. ESL0784]